MTTKRVKENNVTQKYVMQHEHKVNKEKKRKIRISFIYTLYIIHRCKQIVYGRVNKNKMTSLKLALCLHANRFNDF